MFNLIKFKIKNGIKTGYLIGLIPLCLDIDKHYFFNIFNLIRFNKKYTYNTPALHVSKIGTSTNKRKPLLIVSLTSFPERINLAHITISTLLNQSLEPDKIILWLAEEQFFQKENDL